MKAHVAMAVWVLCIHLFPLSATGASGEESSDPRVIEAHQLMGDRSQYPRVIALLREALADGPEDGHLRLELARVLSWAGRYEASLDEYETLIRSSEATRQPRLEHAVVLSWAGRYEEAQIELEALVEEDPGDIEPLVALARVHRWSGRLARADETYARALALRDDPGLRAERRELRADRALELALRFERFEDNGDFRRDLTGLEGSVPLGFATRLLGAIGVTRIRQSGLSGGGSGRDRLLEVGAGLERSFWSGWLASALLGARIWDHSRSRPLVRLRVDYAPRPTLSLGYQFEYSDFLDGSDSFMAQREGIAGVRSGISIWSELAPFEVWGHVSLGALNDHNTLYAAETSFSLRPWKERELRLSLGASYLAYDRESEFYYTPEHDTGFELGLSHRFTLPARLALVLDGGGGLGWSTELGRTTSGPQYHASGELSWSRGKWQAALASAYHRSQRGSVYSGLRVISSLSRKF